MRLTTTAPVRAARELLPWIREHFGSLPAFCEAKGISRITLQKALRGRHKRGVDLEFAVAIHGATDGAIRVEWWSERVPDDVAPESSPRTVLELEPEEQERRTQRERTGSEP